MRNSARIGVNNWGPNNTYRRDYLRWDGNPNNWNPADSNACQGEDVFLQNYNGSASNNIVENCMLDGTGQKPWGYVVSALLLSHYGNANNNRAYGNIINRVQGYSIDVSTDSATYGSNNNSMINNVSFNSQLGIANFGDNNLTVSNNTVINLTTAIQSADYADAKGLGMSINTVSSNNVYDNCPLGGLSAYNNGGTVAITSWYDDIYGCSPSTTGNVTATNTQTIYPNYDTSTYGNGAYLIPPSNLSAAGSGGGPIGATVLYEYQNGTLTSNPLWPWPMESRIVAEFGISPTYEDDGNGHTGGIWKTLDGVYSGTISSGATPDPFTFTYQIGDPLNTTETSNPITVSGINTPTPISITDGTYSINGGAYTSDAGTVNNGDTVTVGVNSSSSPGTMVNATLTIGGVSGIFSVTTSGPSSDPSPSPSSGSYGFVLPDTGQTNCYDSSGSVVACTGTGQDGAYPVNPMSYTDNGNGTVTDNVTGLMWQKQDDGTTRQWSDAGNYCTNLSLGGYSDWRMPTQKELMTVTDYSIPGPGPTINASYFPNTQGSYYWSSTTDAYDAGSAWDVYFGSGSVYSYSQSYPPNYVRCVRGQQAAAGLTDNGDGTVADSGTGLTWQKAEGGSMTWTNALSYCTGLSLGGRSDWRLPNIKELESITDYTRYDPAINTTFFPNAETYFYWSSTTNAGNTGYAWYVYSLNGVVDNGSKSYEGNVRCVSGGQSGSFGNLTLWVSGAGTGSGTILSNPAGIFCSGTCSSQFSLGAQITLTATPASGSAFGGWSGACTGFGPCQVTMDAAKPVIASFTSTSAIVPGAPTGVSATAGNAQTTVSFKAPVSNGGSQVTLYTVTSSPGNIAATGTSSPITVTGLPNFANYTFTVTATNSIGSGPASSPSNMIYQSAQLAVATSPANTVGAVGFTATLLDASTSGANIMVNWGDGNLSGNAAGSAGVAGGTFTHTYPSPGKYTIVHTAVGGTASATENIQVTVPTKFTVSGNVYAPDGQTPIPLATVILKQNGITKKTTTSGAGGAYSLSDVPFGAYTVSAYAAGYTFPASSITINATTTASSINIAAQ